MPADTTNWRSPAATMVDVVAGIFGAALVKGDTIFIGMLPDEPVNAVAFIDTGGGEQDAGQATDTVRVQLIVRDKSYNKGYNLANSIKNELQSLPETVVNTERVVGIWVTSNVALFGKDQSNNNLFSCNFRVVIDTKKNVNRKQTT